MELRNVYTSPNIIRMIKSKMMGLVGHAARMGGIRNPVRSYWRKRQKETNH
jgi:hypothetical protein